MGKNDVNQIADNVRVVHAGCGVNALSSLQNCAKSMDCTASVGLIRQFCVCHQFNARRDPGIFPNTVFLYRKP